jgi:ribosomal protein S18 acetylase RimI-like enzyme
MRASSPAVAYFRPRQIVIAPAAPWDIFFLVSEVASGATAGHFNQSLRDFSSQKFLALQCAKAIILRLSPIRRLAIAGQFIVARQATHTIGAAFAITDQDVDDRRVTTLQYLVVDSGFRRRGVGQMLMQTFMTNAAMGTIVQCACTPKSQGMQRLLRRLGFVHTQKAALRGSSEARVLLPDVWEWCAAGHRTDSLASPFRSKPAGTDGVTPVASEGARGNFRPRC